MDANNQQQLIQHPPSEMPTLDQVNTAYDVRVGPGVTPEHLLVPGFWAHYGAKLKPLDEIRAHAEDGSWLARYLVLDCSRTWARVKQLEFHQLTTSDVALSQASESEYRAFMMSHEVRYRGVHKWCVVRLADSAVLIEGEGDKSKAVAWLEDHARKIVGVQAKAAEPAPA